MAWSPSGSRLPKSRPLLAQTLLLLVQQHVSPLCVSSLRAGEQLAAVLAGAAPCCRSSQAALSCSHTVQLLLSKLNWSTLPPRGPSC